MEASPFRGRSVVKSTEGMDAPSRRPSLLPAFEPLSSSPVGLPRPTTKRKFDDLMEARKYYPTPIPTSSTGLFGSSSPARQTRPGLQRTVSTLSERAPLGDVPTLHIPYNGEPVLMGRSSNSSDYQLPGNRHVSRVHVRASYAAPDSTCPAGKVEVECLGWNGATVHCRGQMYDLAKGDCFSSDKPQAQIMVDVQSTRVMLTWPKEALEPSSSHSKSSWLEESPLKRRRDDPVELASSPPAMLPPRQYTPTSPTPNNAAITSFDATFIDDGSKSPVRVYEDNSSDEDATHEDVTPTPVEDPDQTVVDTSNELTPKPKSRHSFESEDLSEHDEENDPIVHSFGPFGENLLSKFESFKHASPDRVRKPLAVTSISPNKAVPQAKAVAAPSPAPQFDLELVTNHVINQLAYSRIHSLPLSTIHTNLPAELRGAKPKKHTDAEKPYVSRSTLKTVIDGIPCVGEIKREGKDAAGKLLESEFYYIPETDTDDFRRETVTQSLGKTSMRAARKQHKVCQSLALNIITSLATNFSHSNTTGRNHALEQKKGSSFFLFFTQRKSTMILFFYFSSFYGGLFWVFTGDKNTLHVRGFGFWFGSIRV
jgi:hypothetical protein